MVRNADIQYAATPALTRNRGGFGSSLFPSNRPHAEIASYKKRLRGMAAELLLAEERERKRLAVDLHDGLSQLIALAQMKLASLSRSAGEPLEKPLAELRRVIEEANRSVRSLTYQLNPPVLHEGRLGAALEWLVQDIQARYGITARFADDGQIHTADEQVLLVLFRAVRELLINAAKHAGSNEVRVYLRREKNVACVAVEDNGVGMDPRAANAKGCGLLNIRERLFSLGGDMRVESAPGRGTRIHLRAPLSC